jgi:phytoene desaturase
MGKLKVIVVGAGVGGLSAAMRLAHQGFDVEVLEKNDVPGGRCGQLEVDGFKFDVGPTIVLMPEVFEETFSVVGKRLEDYLALRRCDPNYRIHYRDGSAITFTSELTAMGRELERVEKGSFARYLAFLAEGRRQYASSLERFVGRNFDNLWQFISGGNWLEMLRIRAHQKAYAHAARYFRDDRLRAAMTFQTMYLGISPYAAPAVYGLLPFSELGVGIWFPDGGLYAIPLALEKAAKELGVKFRYGCEVKRIDVEGKKATGVTLASGEKLPADAILCNADLPWAYRNLLDPAVARLPNAEKKRYTSSGYLLYIGTKRKLPAEWLHHNVVFGHDYAGSFESIFEKKEVPADPSFYLNIPSRTDPALAPEGKDAVYVLVPVPHRDAAIDWKVKGPQVRAQVMTRLAELGLDLEAEIEVERVYTPDDLGSLWNLEKGSAFGLSHDFWQIGPFRPSNQDPDVKNLFFVGASTQPGTGLPTVMLSARLVVQRMVALGRSLGMNVQPLLPSRIDPADRDRRAA